jgi:hypothetical protein
MQTRVVGQACGSRAVQWSQSGGVSQVAWCREDGGIGQFRLGYWLGKLTAETRSAVPALLPIRIAAPAPDAVIELRFPGGVTLSLSDVDPAWLASRLRGVGAC